MKKQNLLFIGLMLVFGLMLAACQPQTAAVEVEEPAEAVETSSEMAEEEMAEDASMDASEDEEMAEEMAMEEDEAHSDEAMAEEESMDASEDGEMAMDEDEAHSDEAMAEEESMDASEDEEMAEEESMDEGGELMYAVAPADSNVEWRGAKAVGDDHTGTIDIAEGSLTLADGALVSGSFVIDMTTIASNDGANARLAQHLKDDDFFGVATFPTASLVINSAESLGGDQYAVAGDLTIKEITNPIEFTATASEADGQVNAVADIVFDRALYDVQYGSGTFFDGLGNDLINDEVEITVNLVARQ